MSYEVLYTRRAVRDIESLDSVIKKRIASKLVLFSQDPFQFSEKLTNLKLGQYRARVGNYRIVFDVHGHKLIILRVGHRREIYR